MDPFAPPLTGQCCLCGSTEALSGEHKVKAAALRSEFGTQPMVIGRPGERYRHAQSPSSKQFHFSARICETCNNARTQPADLAFDAFRALASDLLRTGKDPAKVHEDPRFNANGGILYLDVFRYFAKLMCCHLAEMGATFYEPIADFAIGISDNNYVLLCVDADVAYRRLRENGAIHSYAAHGGLIVTGNPQSHAPEAFHSTLTIGPVRYCYRIHLNEVGQAQLLHEQPDFYAWCQRRIRHAIDNPMSADDRELLGLNGVNEK
ncbi:hypothetical protein [Xanthomonas euvesicatoria]|uniref:Uncharacterized protein n=3 Tax=Xanthomonas euvesicatoria TaxID=456327 RepID=Q3BZ56_XANE5|nr:hypothetical protein [Xanthomonas euvesicatoria]AOY67919.1 hypothetical protein BHE83_16040 [Xanthomonas euvesicatoria pv. vesicatoria str. 85-10]APO92298.1 hypothetical protein BJD11_21775 [Xanthomonas euvesicatoria]KLB35926.1 hypothetical protein XEUV206_23200 [Xanthomonas euvesicatoria]MCC8515451.1 hypothetical protein [Xanthomonas euvesicatoria pv. euvesicatoria]MCC8547990.1 hypothetical protein [Xanthomonas euvesicatoria pv. euvesicatoria]